MANECTVFEMRGPRIRNAPLRTVPFLARTQLSDDGVITFNKSTTMISVYSTSAGTLDFATLSVTTPTGSTNPFPIAANTLYDFDVLGGSKMRFDI
jgi:hypothetical protein